MLVGALLAGVVVSIATAGLTLLLAGQAAAAEPRGPDPNPAPHAEPGVLLVGAGCEQDLIEASERDWLVRIDARQATIRLMQTFLVRREAQSQIAFMALLPAGARLQSLELQSNRREVGGELLTASQFDRLGATAFEDVMRNAVAVRVQDDGAFSTAPLTLREDEFSLTVSYTYAMPVAVHRARGAALSIALTGTRPPEAEVAPAGGSVWVEWEGRQPARLTQAPYGAELEASTTRRGRIEALSWSSAELARGAQFNLAWAY